MIVALGGSASVGKTTLAAELSKSLDATATFHVDDVASALDAAVGPNFIARPGVWRRPPDDLCHDLVRWTSRLHPWIGCLVSDAQAAGGGIVEGEGIDPRLAQRWDRTQVRALYLVETDPDVLHSTFASRSSAARFLALSQEERRGVVEMNRRYGLWLVEQADSADEPWIPSRPWRTLPRRAARALGLPFRDPGPGGR